MTVKNSELDSDNGFSARHIGPTEKDQKEMLDAIGVASLDSLIKQTVPKAIFTDKPLDLPGTV